MDSELMNLFRRTAALSRRQKRERREAEGKGEHIRGMGHILETLSPEEGKSQKALAAEVGIRPSSLSEALALLEERGEIKRERSSSDGRVTLVYLTEKGEKKRGEVQEARKAHARSFFSMLSQEEKEELMLLLKKINQYFDERQG